MNEATFLLTLDRLRNDDLPHYCDVTTYWSDTSGTIQGIAKAMGDLVERHILKLHRLIMNEVRYIDKESGHDCFNGLNHGGHGPLLYRGQLIRINILRADPDNEKLHYLRAYSSIWLEDE
jgi:hypothetical protein